MLLSEPLQGGSVFGPVSAAQRSKPGDLILDKATKQENMHRLLPPSPNRGVSLLKNGQMDLKCVTQSVQLVGLGSVAFLNFLDKIV